MKKILAAWIGGADENAAIYNLIPTPGPIAQALKWSKFHAVDLLAYPSPQQKISPEKYKEWLGTLFPEMPIDVRIVDLKNPNDLDGIYRAADDLFAKIFKKYGGNVDITCQISAGTPIMAGAWMLLANASRPVTLIESSTRDESNKYIVNKVDIPFEITASYIRSIDESIKTINSSVAAKFKDILFNSDIMRKTVDEAARIAPFDNIPVLIYGESGTGKELFARAIHNACRPGKPIIPVNCGAISENLIESELFGYKEGAFTGALKKGDIGKFMAANGGTLFLDEIGDLPLQAQVKLLRVIDTQKITRVGDTKEEDISVRIVAATHRNLPQAVREGKFRLDLFYRLTVGLVEIPPLRDREGDIELLANEFIKQSNQKPKISVKAMKELRTHNWPGNVRELKNTISRCCYKATATGNIIHEDVVRDAFIQIGAPVTEDILGRELTEGFNINEIIKEVEQHYLVKAMEQSGRNQTKAAKMLGLGRVNFVQWLKRHGIC